MTTVMVVQNQDGKVLRRCDANCHNAKGDVCTCICGGEYHGKGDAGVRREKMVLWVRGDETKAEIQAIQLELPF